MVADEVIVAGLTIPPRIVKRVQDRIARRASDRCWEWTGARTSHGYGRVNFSVGGKTYHEYTHRIVYAATHGETPAGLVVRHSCDNPPCCNPAHLLIGTQGDNIRDRTESGRHLAAALRGEANKNARLTDDAVLEIRRAYAEGRATQKELGAAFGVRPAAISAIVRGVRWSHVGGPRTFVGVGYASRRDELAVSR